MYTAELLRNLYIELHFDNWWTRLLLGRCSTVYLRNDYNISCCNNAVPPQCEEKCGSSIETRTAVCASKNGKIYPDSFCLKYKAPELVRKCEDPPSCEHQWYATQWSKVSTCIATLSQTGTPQSTYLRISFYIYKKPKPQ